MMRFFNSLSSIFGPLGQLVNVPVRLWPFSSRSSIIWVAWSTSPLAIVMQCLISKIEVSWKISWSAAHSSAKKSHVFSSLVPLISHTSDAFLLTSLSIDLDSNFDSGIISDNRKVLHEGLNEIRFRFKWQKYWAESDHSLLGCWLGCRIFCFFLVGHLILELK